MISSFLSLLIFIINNNIQLYITIINQHKSSKLWAWRRCLSLGTKPSSTGNLLGRHLSADEDSTPTGGNWTVTSDNITGRPIQNQTESRNLKFMMIQLYSYSDSLELSWNIETYWKLLDLIMLSVSQKLVFNRSVPGQNLALKVSSANASWRSKAHAWRVQETS